jgi:hypothetical protein
MTFDEWFDKNYPFGYAVLPRSAGEQLAREAWEAGFREARLSIWTRCCRS